jgi:translocation and assembly module TamA
MQRAVQNQPYFSNVQVDLVEPADAEAEAKGEAGTASDAATEADGATTTTKTTKATQSDTIDPGPSAGARATAASLLPIPASVTDRHWRAGERTVLYYNLFNRAWVFDSQLSIEQKRQYAYLETAMPPDTRTFRNSIYSSYERTIDVESTDLTSWRAV